MLICNLESGPPPKRIEGGLDFRLAYLHASLIPRPHISYLISQP